MKDEEFEPPYLFPDYRATRLRAPQHPPVKLPEEWFHHAPGPVFGRVPVGPHDADLTAGHPGEPLGERIIVSGRVTDSDGITLRLSIRTSPARAAASPTARGVTAS